MENRIEQLRKEKGLTLKDLANEFNEFTKNYRDTIKPISYATLSRWEKGVNDPPSKAIEKLADYFDVPISYLQGLGMSENKFKEKLFDSVAYSPNFAKNIAGYFPESNKKIILSVSNEITKDNYQELKGNFISFFDIKTIGDKYNFFSSIDPNISDDEFQSIVLDKLNNNISVFDFSYMFPELHKRLINIFDRMTIEDEYFILKEIGKNIVFDELKKHYQKRVKKESNES